jgi:hypothetical protein
MVSETRPGLLLAGLLTLLTLFAGCWNAGSPKLKPIRGNVRYRGQPVAQGVVIYGPRDANGRPARGEIQSDGSFAMSTYHPNDGVQHGDYVITVVVYGPSMDGMSREQIEQALAHRSPIASIPEKYSDPERSPLCDQVHPQHDGTIQLNLED